MRNTCQYEHSDCDGVWIGMYRGGAEKIRSLWQSVWKAKYRTDCTCVMEGGILIALHFWTPRIDHTAVLPGLDTPPLSPCAPSFSSEPLSFSTALFLSDVCLFPYLFDCAKPQLRHVESSLFTVAHGILQLHHVGCSSLTRDWTQAPCIGSLEF